MRPLVLLFAGLLACQSESSGLRGGGSASADGADSPDQDARPVETDGGVADVASSRPDVQDEGHWPDGGATADAGGADDSGTPRFRFPVHADDRAKIGATPVFGVDHDPAQHSGIMRYQCQDHHGRGFPWCYDGHSGSDFMLSGGFRTMDSGSARVVAAAGGVVRIAEDGHYDRCHADLATADVSCDGNPVEPNFVVLDHADGWVTQYYHLKQGSIAVQPGQRVACGELLGLIGSSGYSSAPHIHFEVHDRDKAVWDPFSGPLSQAMSLWGAEDAGDGLPGDVCDPGWR